MASEVGSGQVAIFPVFKGFRSRVSTEVDGATKAAGQSAGKGFSAAFNSSAGSVGADTAKKLSASVASAAKALSAARLSEQDATGKVRVAEAALADARSKGAAGSARVVAAEERLASSQRKLTEATSKTTNASMQLKSAQGQLAAAQASAGSAGEASASRFARGWEGLKAKLSSSTKTAVDQAGSSASASAESSGRRAGGGFSSGFKGALGGMGAAVAAVGFGSFIAEAARASDATDKFKATMSFAGLNTKAIDAASKAAKAYADQTVFDLPTIQNTMAQLASNGVKDYTGLTKAAGNLNAVAGGNAETFKSVAMTMTQTAGAGKLTTENWNQMADAIPGAAGPLMKALQKSGAYTGNFRDAMADGQITADEFNAALMKLGNDPVAVEAAKSTKTFEGAIGSLQATLTSGLMSALDAMKPGITGAINLLTKGLGGAFTWIGNAAKGLGALFASGDFTGALRTAFHVEEDSPLVDFLFRIRETAITVAGGFRAMFAAYKAGDGDVTSSGFAGFMERVGNTARTITGGIRAMFAAYKAGDGDVTSSGFAGFMERVGNVLRETTGGVRAFFAAFKAGDGDVTSSGFAGFMEQLGNAARQLFDAIGPAIRTLLPQIVSLWSAFSPLQIILRAIQPLLPQLVGLFGQVASTIGTTLGTVLTNILPMFMRLSGVISQSLGTVLAAVLPVAVQLISMLSATLAQLMPVILPIVATIIELATSLISQLAPIITNLVSAILPPLISIFGNILTAIGPVISMVAGLLIPIIQALMPVVVTVFSVVADVIRNAMQIVQGIIQVVTGIITGNWSQVWTGIQNIFGGIWNTIVSLVRGALQIVGQVVISGLGLVGGFVSSVLGNIGRFFSDTWSNVTRGVSGFIDGFVGFFRDLPGKAVAAISGLTGQMLTVGQNIVQGLIDGAKGMVDKAVQAVKDVGGSMLKGIQDFLGIKSPSREFMKIGGWVTAGLAKGVQQKTSVAVKAITGVAAKLRDEAAKRLAPKNLAAVSKAYGAAGVRQVRAEAAALTRSAANVAAQIGQLTSLAKRREALVTRLKTSQKQLNAAIAVRNKQAAESTKTLAGEFKLSDLVGRSASTIRLVASGVAARIKAFGVKMATLRKLGLHPSLIAEVGALGSEDGSAVADALIRGGKGEVAGLNAAYKSIGSYSKGAGAAIADGMYGAGIDGLKGLVNGFAGNIKAIDQAAKKVTDRLTAQVKKNLGIRSPSRKFRIEVGHMAGEGMALGIEDMIPRIQAASERMAAIPSTLSAARPVAGSSAASGAAAVGATGRQTPQIVINGDVYGDPEQYAGQIQTKWRRAASLNNLRKVAIG